MKNTKPLAMTMWDFSWLERRWTGGGYENWPQALDELVERGYNAVRIDAYPHFQAKDADRAWELLPQWNQQVWGSPAKVTVTIRQPLMEFLALCRDRQIAVALSSWFRQDVDDTRLGITTPEDLASIWKQTLDAIASAGLLDVILFVDLCNEFGNDDWSPFLSRAVGRPGVNRVSPEGRRWMQQSIEALRTSYPHMDLCFSFHNQYDGILDDSFAYMDLLEPHIWMANFSDFYDKVGYAFERFSSAGYENLVEKGERLYRQDPLFWQEKLTAGIDLLAQWSDKHRRPLVTTECWGPIDFKDGPGLNWEWVKELCELGVRRASATGNWSAIATSNFCGPQFVGMWQDIEWHQKLTTLIRQGPLKSFERFEPSQPFFADASNGHLSGPGVTESRKLISQLSGVFANEAARSQLPPDTLAYRVQMHAAVSEKTTGGLFFGTSFVSPGVVDGEYFMTRGHFHAVRDRAEYYWCLGGEGYLLLMGEDRTWQAQKMTPSSVHYIAGHVAHRLINTGSTMLTVGACWPSDAGHDYDTITQKGFSVRCFRGVEGPEWRGCP